MKSRWTGFLVCAIPAVLMLAAGLVLPAHLRSVDAIVLQRAGRNTPGPIEEGMTLIRQNKLGAAQLLLRAAQEEDLPGQERLGQAITTVAMLHPAWLVWGGGDPRLERLFVSDPHLPKSGVEPFTDFLVRHENRMVVLELLGSSQLPAVQELLRCRGLTNTVIFPPSQSASGQAIDTAVGICGLLLEGGHMSGGLSDAVLALAGASLRGGDPQRLEQVLLDLMSLGQRFNWGQLVAFTRQIQDPEALRLLAIQVRDRRRQLPVIFAATELSGKPGQVADYLMKLQPDRPEGFGRQSPLWGGGGERAVAAQPAVARCGPRRADGGGGAVRRDSRFDGGFMLAQTAAGR